MKSILIILLLTLTICVSGQSNSGNSEMIEKIKTKKDKSTIEQLLIGHWQFIEMQSPQGDIIDTIYHKVPNGTTGIEIVERTDYLFYDDMTYSANSAIRNDTTDGTWEYKTPEKEVVLTFYEPVLPVDDSMPEDYIKNLVDQGVLKPIESSFFEIHIITDKELWIIEHLPHNENELKYNLLYYKKK